MEKSEKEFLYETFDNKIASKEINKVELPHCITDNLRHSLRDYQLTAFRRFIYYLKEYADKSSPCHLLFNMATGSGKTLIMAGLMLYLYQRGYRNFLFFVNATNIIDKTKDNFINSISEKYLFRDEIIIDGREISIKEVNGYWSNADDCAINIKFSTIQQLHEDLENPKENGIAIEDMADMKLVLLADEAHHLNAKTKRVEQTKELFDTWENTIEKIHQANKENLILEFTATTDYNSKEISNKYKDKVICKYDLKEYREDKYSKEINLFRFQGELEDRMLYAVLFNMYRNKVASDYLQQNFKAVMLFKSKIIKDSNTNYEIFRNLIDNLTEERVAGLLDMQVMDLEDATTNIGTDIYNYLKDKHITISELITEIQNSFTENNCIVVDSSDKKRNYAKYMNTLEDASNNPIRAIFAVDMLIEGWDVLNLFDIVRLYETRDSGNTTMMEAQLIGRGARYYPFVTDDNDDKYRRKYDNEPQHPLKVIETLYYHTLNDSKYIYEIKQALIKEGLIDEYTKEMFLKDSFRKTKLYTSGRIYVNELQPIENKKITETKYYKIEYQLPTYRAIVSKAIDDEDEDDILSKKQIYTNVSARSISLSKIPLHIVRYAISKHKDYTFDKLKQKYANINSTTDFIDKYLKDSEIVFNGDMSRITNKHLLDAVYKLLDRMYLGDSPKQEHRGSEEFERKDFNKIFPASKKYGLSREQFDNYMHNNINHSADWYVYGEHYATSEEKEFVKFFERHYDDMATKYEEIYLIRNERTVKIYNFADGRGFEPDFLLFCKEKNGEQQTFQVFIEPKGNHLLKEDNWKIEFLSLIDNKEDKYYIMGIPKFYNNKHEKEFEDDFFNRLKITAN